MRVSHVSHLTFLVHGCSVLALVGCGSTAEDVSETRGGPHGVPDDTPSTASQTSIYETRTPDFDEEGVHAVHPDTLYESFGDEPGERFEQCQADEVGNWVCVWENPGWAYAAGPCAFTPDGKLWVNYRAPDGENLLNHMVKMSPRGEVITRRVESGEMGQSVNSLTAIDMVPTHDGGVVWVGQQSVDWPDPDVPATSDSLDGVIVRLDGNGERVDEWSYGGPGLQRIWDIAPAPNGGFYVFGEDLFVRMSAEFEIIWDLSDEEPSDANGGALRLASNSEGLLATSYAIRDSDGNRLTNTTTVGHGNDHLVFTKEGRLVSSAGFVFTLKEGILEERLPVQAQRLITGHQSFVGTNRLRNSVTEVSYDGELLCTHEIPGAASNWYNGGTCLAPDGSVAVSADSVEDSDFGILESEIPSAGRSFVLYLKGFGAK